MILTSLIGLLFILLSISGCSDCKPVESSGGLIYTSTPLEWVSTDAVYDSTIGEHELSLLYFTAGWCGYCTKMKDETFHDSVVVDLMNSNFNLVQIDTEADSLFRFFDSTARAIEILRYYQVTGIPHIIVLNKQADTLGRIRGYYSYTYFRGMLQNIIDSNQVK